MDITLFAQLTIPAEAERGRVYDDATGETIGPGTLVKGNPTIAIGRNVGPSGLGLRESEMVSMLDNDELAIERDARAFAWYPKLSPVRQTVVACMIFNLGLPRFSGFHNLINALAAATGEGVDAADQGAAYVRAHSEMLASHWAEPPPIGVGARAIRLADIMLSGVP